MSNTLEESLKKIQGVSFRSAMHFDSLRSLGELWVEETSSDSFDLSSSSSSSSTKSITVARLSWDL